MISTQTTTTTKINHHLKALAELVALMAACLLMAASPAHASTTFTVDRNDDPDPTTANACTVAREDCSLRGAIVAANATAGADAITLPAGTYTLTRDYAGENGSYYGDLDITDELTIKGAGARSTSVVGGPSPYDDRIFDNQPDTTATITGLTITGGKTENWWGGGVSNGGNLTLDRVAVSNNTAEFTVVGFGTVGGGIANYGTLNLTDSTVSGNSATNAAGIAHLPGSLGGSLNITNTTISGNKATRFASGAYIENSPDASIVNSTIANNESGRLGGGLMTGVGTTLLVKNTIVANNSLGDCDTGQFGGTISSEGNNISSDESCYFTKATDKQNTDPLLSPLQDNGGPADTRALLPGSPAIDAGTNTGCPDTDQRGVARPQGVRCDIGAFEKEAPPNAAPTATNDAYKVKSGRTLRVSAPGVLKNDSDPDSDLLTARLVSGPTKGTLHLNSNGSFSYKPNVKKGTDSFVYKVRDGKGGTDKATVNIRVVRRS